MRFFRSLVLEVTRPAPGERRARTRRRGWPRGTPTVRWMPGGVATPGDGRACLLPPFSRGRRPGISPPSTAWCSPG